MGQTKLASVLLRTTHFFQELLLKLVLHQCPPKYPANFCELIDCFETYESAVVFKRIFYSSGKGPFVGRCNKSTATVSNSNWTFIVLKLPLRKMSSKTQQNQTVKAAATWTRMSAGGLDFYLFVGLLFLLLSGR